MNIGAVAMAKAVYVTQESLEADLCRDFKFFRDLFWETVPGAGKMKYNWHLDVFCDEAQTVIERIASGLPREYDLAVNVPPGTSKSTVFSILLPAWAWTQWPWIRFLSASHTDALVLDLANKSRSVIKSDKYQKLFPHIVLKEDQDAKGYFANTLGGDRFTCTAAGKSPIGRHAHVQLLDDIINPKGVTSQLSLETARAFVDEELITRKVDKAVTVTILVMQRLGVGDPTDVMVKGAEREGAAPVRHVVLPSDLDKMADGKFKSDDVKPEYLANRYVDGLLDPVRMSQTSLSEFRARGDHYFSTQFRQKPYSKKGGMFREEYFMRRVKAAPYEARRIRFWDMAACLVPGTLISTRRGFIPIESVKEGDEALTRRGFRRVNKAWKTKEVSELTAVLFSNGQIVAGTCDHKIWVDNLKIWVPLATIDRSCEVVEDVNFNREMRWHESTQNWKWCISTEEGIQDTQEQHVISETSDGMRSCKSTESIHCIETHGNFITAPYPIATLFITEMGTNPTMRLKIWSASHTRNMQQGILNGGQIIDPSAIQKCERRLLQDFENGLLLNEGLRNLENNAAEEGKRHRNVPRAILESTNADFARGSLTQEKWGISLPVAEAKHASRNDIDNAFLSCGRAKCANADSKDTKTPSAVLEVVQLFGPILTLIEKQDTIPVYDLEVDEDHEFFANGVLVHNSSEGTGGCETAGVLICEAETQAGNVKLRKWYVEDVVVGQWEPYERNQKVKAVAMRDRIKYGPAHEPVILIEREGGSSGKEVMQFLVQFLAGFNVREYNPSRAGSKERRAENWSAELAAGNVYLVDDGGNPKWDITGFVDQHVAFPLAPRKDMVDAAAGAFLNLVSGKRDMGIPGKIVHALGERSKTHRIRIIVCNMDQMPDLQFEEPWVLVQLCNPEPCRQLTLPGHDPRMVGSLMLEFCDMEPALMQDRWTMIVDPYNKPPSELIPKQEHGKKLWAFLTKKRDPAPWVYVIQGPPGDDMRAQSVAYGICDALRLRREETIWHLGATDFVAREDEQPGLRHLYDTVRATRHLVG